MNEVTVWMRFGLAVLATWRITHLLASEDGPADIIVRVRALLGDGLVGKLMDCFNCLSLWVAAPVALFVSRDPYGWLLSCLALSGAACLLERSVPDSTVGGKVWNASRRDADYVLRTKAPGAEERFDDDECASHSIEHAHEFSTAPLGDKRVWSGTHHVSDPD
jgi:hypothetical protein